MKQLSLFPEIFVRDRRAFCSSLDVAAHFGKPHKDVLRAIRDKMEDHSAEFSRRNFAPSDYLSERGKIYPMFNLTRDAFMTVAMGFTGREAAQWREMYIAEFNRMEAKIAELERKEAELEGRLLAAERLAGAHRANLAGQAMQLIEEGCRFAEAARLLGVSRHVIYRLRRRFGFLAKCGSGEARPVAERLGLRKGAAA